MKALGATAESYGAASEEAEALAADAADPVPSRRHLFEVPPLERAGPGAAGEVAYLAGNSLGLLPRAARRAVADELDAWSTRAVEGWLDGRRPFYERAAELRAPLAALLGAERSEAVVMNGLTVNLHLMLASFYRPAGERVRVVVEEAAFPSDAYAVSTHLRWRGVDPAAAIVRVVPREGESLMRTEDVVDLLESEGATIALVLLPGVQYLTGQLLDMAAITAAGRAAGCVVGWDLAHAVGNVPLACHDCDMDFAVFCTYKYLNAGPGSPGGCFVHDRHAADASIGRLGGWWGNDPATRFAMSPDFVPAADAGGWQLSTPSILALAPLAASLEIFAGAGLGPLRERSVRLTGFLERALGPLLAAGRAAMISPTDPAARGGQLSLRVPDAAALVERLSLRGVVCDARPPDVLRLAPAPLYNSFHDVWRAAAALAEALA